MLEFKKTELEVNIYGTVRKLRRPTVLESQEYAKLAAKGDEAKTTEGLMDLLRTCGLPTEVAEAMEPDHLIQLIEALMPKKKG